MAVWITVFSRCVIVSVFSYEKGYGNAREENAVGDMTHAGKWHEEKRPHLPLLFIQSLVFKEHM